MVDIATFEQGPPRVIAAGSGGAGGNGGRYLARERCETFNSHWGTSARDFSMKSPAEVIRILVECRRYGGNLLMNVGPTPGGALPAYEAASLALVGRWIETCGASIYEGVPAAVRCRGRDFGLQGGGAWHYFAHDIEITDNTHLHHGGPGGLSTIQGGLPAVRRVTWVNNGEELGFSPDVARGILMFDAAAHSYGEQRVVRVARVEMAEGRKG